ncbi:MAG TPA: glycosyltransferase family A protein [Opitutaceae bacterium]|nr:glycosyltransferase family A protein [Opitutaceae bacterium]
MSTRPSVPPQDFPVALSIGVMAWNEEDTIGPMLDSLFAQSIFAFLAARGERCEVVCLANGCTDRTVAVAAARCARAEREHPARRGLTARVADIREPGRNHAWNLFVHEFSAREARFICLMDADIVFNRVHTVQLVLSALEHDPHLGGASDWPCKTIAGKDRPSLRERLSLATSDMTGGIPGRLNGMMYCLRAGIARNLYLPRDLGATDDGFFKAIICTDFFREPLDATKVVSVREATHLYEPYLSVRDILNNQKRQMIGQTTLEVIFNYLRTLPEEDRANLAATIRANEARDPDWLKKLIAAHMARVRHFWQLFPGLLGFRWRRYRALRGRRRLAHLPAALAGFAVTLIASWRAARFLRRGIAPFWPKTGRQAPAAALLTANPAAPHSR